MARRAADLAQVGVEQAQDVVDLGQRADRRPGVAHGIARLERNGDDVRFYVDCAPELAAMLVDKGSVSIDGVSLTVVEPRADGFHVVLIPHTLSVTTLGDRAIGGLVNLEVDVIAKYVERLLEAHSGVKRMSKRRSLRVPGETLSSSSTMRTERTKAI